MWKKANEHEEMAINFGALGYKDDIICTILNCNISELDDEFWQLYRKGEAMAQYVMDLKLFEMAKAGDLKAMQTWKMSKAMQSKIKR